jgi:thioesterase domain-containing protein/aryl carrier-like protein
LAGIWQDVLQIDRVGRHDNFFELGGNSLSAARLVGQLKRFGVDLPLMAIFQHGTIEQLADIVSRQSRSAQRRSDNLVPIRTAGSRTPLFLVHEVSGQVLPYITLAGLLDADQPVYGLQASGPGDDTQGQEVETMASRYIVAIRQVQPEGPYRLAGWSAGGLVAYEMATQLLAKGEQVEFVGLIDAQHPEPGRESVEPGDTALLLAFLQTRHAVPEEQLLRLGKIDDLPTLASEAAKAGLLPADVQLDEIRRYLGIYRGQAAAQRRYRPTPTAATVHLFTAADETGQDPQRGWGALLGSRLRVQPIGGTHQTIVLPPHAADVAAAITAALERRA